MAGRCTCRTRCDSPAGTRRAPPHCCSGVGCRRSRRCSQSTAGWLMPSANPNGSTPSRSTRAEPPHLIERLAPRVPRRAIDELVELPRLREQHHEHVGHGWSRSPSPTASGAFDPRRPAAARGSASAIPAGTPTKSRRERRRDPQRLEPLRRERNLQRRGRRRRPGRRRGDRRRPQPRARGLQALHAQPARSTASVRCPWPKRTRPCTSSKSTSRRLIAGPASRGIALAHRRGVESRAGAARSAPDRQRSTPDRPCTRPASASGDGAGSP